MGVAFGCVGNTIRLFSGGYLDLLDPDPETFTIRDIACGLSKICRFGGQIEQWYSVAEHSIWCAHQAADDRHGFDVQLACLMHDAAEAFVGDVVKPLKMLLPEYAEIERGMEAAIARKFGIDFDAHKEIIREIDHAMLIAERRKFFSVDHVQWAGESEVRELRHGFIGMPHRIASTEFIKSAERLLAVA